MFAALFAFVLAYLAHLQTDAAEPFPPPEPAGPSVVVGPVVERPAEGSEGSTAPPSLPSPEPAPVVELGPGEYAPQLPEETTGRAY